MIHSCTHRCFARIDRVRCEATVVHVLGELTGQRFLNALDIDVLD